MHPTDIPGGLYTAPRKLTPPAASPEVPVSASDPAAAASEAPPTGLQPPCGGLRLPQSGP
jgi:hypothetical protein